MRAARVNEPGALPALEELDEPEGELLEILAAPLNRADLIAATGALPGREFPYTPGYEAVGRLADGRTVWAFGDGIGYGGPHGAMAERVPVAGARVYELPSASDPALAGALGIAGLAGWLAAAYRAPVREGDVALVLGATGAAGQVALQAARVLGASRVVAAGRNRKALERSLGLGADTAVALDEPELAAAFAAACGGEGPTWIFDPLWGRPVVAALEAAGESARLVTVGQMAGPVAEIPNRSVRAKAVTVVGSHMYDLAEEELGAQYRTLLAHAQAGRIVVDLERVPLADVREAWRRKLDGDPLKLVLVP